MVIQTAIFKIGGKILDNSKNLINTVAQFTQLFEDSIIKKIIIIPGGGLLANFVRKTYIEFNLNNNLAHWIAIYSMDYNGRELNRKFPHLKLCDNYEKLNEESRGISIFLPYKYLRNENELPHSWEVTSDSISIYLAKKFGLNTCFLIKDIEGILDSNQNIIKEISSKEFIQLKEEGKIENTNSKDLELKDITRPIDPYLLILIDKYKIPCIILNGANPEPRIFNFFIFPNLRDKVFTKLYSI
ncbi:MAG: hypothetical protein ACFFA6_06990 [Promethearchaeota archaeon]